MEILQRKKVSLMSSLSRYNLLSTMIRNLSLPKHKLNGAPASDINNITITQGILHFSFLCEDLMCRNNISEQGRNTRLKNVILLTHDYDFSIIINTLKTAYDVLINHISGKNVLDNYNHFKGEVLSDNDTFPLGKLLSPIKEDVVAILSSQTFVSSGVYKNNSAVSMKSCASYLLFLSKLNFEDVGLEADALVDYLSAEEENIQQRFDPTLRTTVALQNIIAEWFHDWEYDEYSYQHGTGSVADTKKASVYKYLSLSTDSKMNYVLKDTDINYQSVAHYQYSTKTLERTSKLVFVPKNITKLRSISMEPATLQFHQQGVMKSLMRYFRTQKELRNILFLDDQSINQSFAYHGSITNDYATIDLSHASDSVCWSLVKILFKRVPKLLKWMLCTRSTNTTLPTKETIALAKFAPMGSALCFPVESIIFAAIAKLSVLWSREQMLDRDDKTGIHAVNNKYLAYGDDIIIPSYATVHCIDLLRECGFTPNESKSYMTGPFKESCGGNYFCGVDITPIKFHPKYELSAVSKGFIGPKTYIALCSSANLAYEHGHKMLRLSIIHSLLDNNFKPLFSDKLGESPAIFSPTPTNYHLQKRYSKDKRLGTDYQKYEYTYDNISVKPSLKTRTMAYRALLARVSYTDYWIKSRDRLPALSNGYSLITHTFDNDLSYNHKVLETLDVVFCRCTCDA